ncbi:MAG: sigma-70 family RNA polymerase sigma factor [Deltaproteobacteria bacterium]|nr:sigma-70 family RNA polymerase sigma factor [Deltaproteobacteria bacterium]
MAEWNGSEAEKIFLADVALAGSAQTDSVAAEALLRRIYPKIFQVVHSLVQNRENVDDMAQQSAIEVMKSLSNYAGRGSIEAWAGRIAYRVTKRTIKSERLRMRLMQPLSEDRAAPDCSPEESVSRSRLYDMLVGKMAQIPEKQRVPLLLHVAYGYTVDEVAQITDSSRNTVKYRLKSGYRVMREILAANPALRTAMLREIS